MSFRFLHAADIHLDSPLRGLERYASAPAEAVRSAPRRAFENLIDLALNEAVDFLLIAGDLYDGDWKDYNTGVFFVSQMRRLESAGIPVHLVSGNHDAASQITKRLRLPGNVTHYDHKKPQTTLLESLGVAIHGQSFKGRSVQDDLSENYPPGQSDRFDIGLLHTSLDGRPGHDVYAPCSVEGLRSKGYDYWALGHVHRRDEVSDAPWIVFPGNLQGRHARETGAKGATLVTVEGGRVQSVEHRALDVLRWVVADVDLSDRPTAEDSIDAVREVLLREQAAAEGRPIAVRLRLTGRSPAHGELCDRPDRWVAEYREQASALSGGGDEEAIWIEKVLFETGAAVDLEAAMERGDALGELLRRIDRVGAEYPDDASREAERDWLAGAAADLRRKLPEPLLRKQSGGDDEFDPQTGPTLDRALAGAKALLVARLLDLSAEGAVESADFGDSAGRGDGGDAQLSGRSGEPA